MLIELLGDQRIRIYSILEWGFWLYSELGSVCLQNPMEQVIRVVDMNLVNLPCCYLTETKTQNSGSMQSQRKIVYNFKSVRDLPGHGIHIVSPQWHKSTLKQLMGRIVRVSELRPVLGKLD